jgi:hypothetical protein
MTRLGRKIVYDIYPTVARADDPVVADLIVRRTKRKIERLKTKISTTLITTASLLLAVAFIESVVLDIAMSYGAI